jgi:hypothetical protein
MSYMIAVARETALPMRDADAHAPQRAIVMMKVSATFLWRNFIFRSVYKVVIPDANDRGS